MRHIFNIYSAIQFKLLSYSFTDFTLPKCKNQTKCIYPVDFVYTLVRMLMYIKKLNM